MSADTRVLRMAGPHVEDRLILADDLEDVIRAEYSDLDGIEEALAELTTTGSSAWLDLAVEPVEVAELEDYDWSRLVGTALESGAPWREAGMTLSTDGPLMLERYPETWRGPGAPKPPATGLLLDGEPADVSAGWASVRAQIASRTVAALERAVTDTSRRRREAQARLESARAAQHEAMRAAIARGVSAYRVAKLSGLTERAVHKIRDGA